MVWFHVGNLAWGVDDLALENLFSEQGKVMEAMLVYDRESGRSRGFGFVTYSSVEEVNSAIEYLKKLFVYMHVSRNVRMRYGFLL